MTCRIHLGISTCPNDTFAFHALLNKLVDWRGIDFDVKLLDIQTLNEGLFDSQFDVAKASFHAAILLADQYWVLPSGSALGFGVGPLLLSADRNSVPNSLDQLTLCPGEHTTATLLYRLFYPERTQLKQVVFSEIMPKLQRHEANFGVCIHEGRFTWQQEGLGLVEDLGTRWESETGFPLPLGGIVASKKLDPATLNNVQSVIRESILYAMDHKEQTIPTMRKYAQEFSDQVLMQHVDLYVNQWTIDLGLPGQQALDELSHRAHAVGIAAHHGEKLEVRS